MSISSSDRLVFDDDSAIACDPREALRNRLRSFKLFKPPFVLALFVLMNFWTYYDRGAMSTSVATIRSDPTIATGGSPITEASAGLLVSIFMVGYLVASPIFAGLGGLLGAKTIILIGLVVWCVACLTSGLVHGFYGLLVTRAFVGVGEAAYAGYTVTMVDNMAPPEKRTLWIGIFYAMIPVGTALGMIAGGVMSSDAGTSSFSGWRFAFVTEVIPMGIVVAITAFLPKEYNPVKDDAPKVADSLVSDEQPSANDADLVSLTPRPRAKVAHDEFVPIHLAVIRLFTNIDYLCLVFGYGMYTFVVGGIAVWAVSFMSTGPLHTTKVQASIFLGGTVAFGGMLGSLAGGVAVDKLGGSLGYSGVYKSSVFNTAMVLVSFPLGIIAISAHVFPVFAIPFVISIFALFAVTAPVNSAILSSVPRNLRTYAVTFGITIMHLCGDVPSPVVAGAIADAFDSGCSQWNNNQTLCQESFRASDCVWVPKESHSDQYCTNEFELRNALLIVFGFLALAIPAWGAVALRMRGRTGDADNPDGDESENGPLVWNAPPPLRDIDAHE